MRMNNSTEDYYFTYMNIKHIVCVDVYTYISRYLPLSRSLCCAPFTPLLTELFVNSTYSYHFFFFIYFGDMYVVSVYIFFIFLSSILIHIWKITHDKMDIAMGCTTSMWCEFRIPFSKKYSFFREKKKHSFECDFELAGLGWQPKSKSSIEKYIDGFAEVCCSFLSRFSSHNIEMEYY